MIYIEIHKNLSFEKTKLITTKNYYVHKKKLIIVH